MQGKTALDLALERGMTPVKALGDDRDDPEDEKLPGFGSFDDCIALLVS